MIFIFSSGDIIQSVDILMGSPTRCFVLNLFVFASLIFCVLL